jgi:hypothetical protein
VAGDIWLHVTNLGSFVAASIIINFTQFQTNFNCNQIKFSIRFWQENKITENQWQIAETIYTPFWLVLTMSCNIQNIFFQRKITENNYPCIMMLNLIWLQLKLVWNWVKLIIIDAATRLFESGCSLVNFVPLISTTEGHSNGSCLWLCECNSSEKIWQNVFIFVRIVSQDM